MRDLRAALGATQQDALADADRRQSMGGRRSSIVGGKRSKRMIVAVLDEMDQLISQDQSVLYELFTLATVRLLCCSFPLSTICICAQWQKC